MKTLFITGIDTNVGKSYATGILARTLQEYGINTITQKMIQTGNTGYSEDINLHRSLMLNPHADEPLSTVAPSIYAYPASPHLAAKMEQRPVDLTTIDEKTRLLASRYDLVLLEGAGGLMVPIDDQGLTTADFIAARHYPTVVVTSGKLGSISHTLLTLEVLRSRGIDVPLMIYNRYPATDSLIEDETRSYLAAHLARHSPATTLIEMPAVEISKPCTLDLPIGWIRQA